MADYIYEPYIHEQATPADTWNVTHGFGREVSVTIYNTSGKEILGDVEKVDDNSLTIKFYYANALVAVAGKAVVS